MLGNVCIVVKLGWWEIILSVAYLQLVFTTSPIGLHEWVLICRVGFLVITLRLSWNLKFRNCRYSWNTLLSVFLLQEGNHLLPKENVLSLKEVLIITEWPSHHCVQFIIQNTMSGYLGWKMMINRRDKNACIK